MTNSCNLTAPVASVWIQLMSLVARPDSAVVRSDNAITAKVQLQETITHLKQVEDSLREDLKSSAVHVRAAQASHAKTTLQHLLMRTRAKRMRLTQTANKRVNIEQQLDALCMSELNNQVLTSMQKTSVALKSLGVREAVEDADEVMLDMQEAHQDLSAMQDALGQPINMDTLDETVLAAELEMLLNGDEDMLLHAPNFQNKMQVGEADAKKVTTPTPEPNSVPQETPAESVENEAAEPAHLALHAVA